MRRRLKSTTVPKEKEKENGRGRSAGDENEWKGEAEQGTEKEKYGD